MSTYDQVPIHGHFERESGGFVSIGRPGATGTLLPNVQGRRLVHPISKLPVTWPQMRNIGTRALHHRCGTANNSGGNQSTWQITAEMAQQFDAVRVVLVNANPSKARYFTLAVSAPSTAADLNNNSGTWVTGGEGSDNTIVVDPAPLSFAGVGGVSLQRLSYGYSAWIPLSSVPRTDDPTKSPLVAARVYDLNGDADLTVYNGTNAEYVSQDLTPWATRTNGRMWASRNKVGSYNTVTSGAISAGFDSTTNISQSPIIAIQYLARGKVITVASCGDSIYSGQGTFKGEGFGLPAADMLQALLAPQGIAVEYSDMSWAGQGSGSTSGSGYALRALDIMRGEMRPDLFVFGGATPNDQGATGITAAQITAQKGYLKRVIELAQKTGTLMVIGTQTPANTSSKQWGATDALRRAQNAEILAAWNTTAGIATFDASSAVSGVDDGTGQIQFAAGMSADGLHPNDAANALIAPLVYQGLLTLIYGG